LRASSRILAFGVCRFRPVRYGRLFKRFGEPEEISELVLFMCSDACEFMTADTVYVNGGGGWR
jgi:NAD(P)-dependent dehydrogenase (short-subunit alcohol dehydrogenase family)